MPHRFPPTNFQTKFLTAIVCTCTGILLVSLTGCTVVDTTPVPHKKVDESKAQAGRYYMLPKALITIEGVLDKDTKQYLVNASGSLVADRRHRYFLRWKQNPFYDDVLSNLDVDSDGLLASVNYTAEDRTPQIITDLANTTVNIFKLIGRVAPSGQALSVEAGTEKREFLPFKYTFDPLDEVEVSRVIDELRDKNMIKLVVAGPARGKRSRLTAPLRANEKGKTDDLMGYPMNEGNGGVLYHPPTTVEMLLTDLRLVAFSGIPRQTAQAKTNPPTGQPPTPTAGDEKPDKPANGGGGKDETPAPSAKPLSRVHVVMTVPDVDKVVSYRAGRSFLTKRESGLAFVRGMPTTLAFKQPSTIQAFTGLVSGISGIAASAVPTLFNVKVNREVADLQAQKRLIDAQANLATSQGTLNKALASNSEATANATKKAAALSIDPGDESQPDSPTTLKKTIATRDAALEVQKQQDTKRRTLMIVEDKAAGLNNEQINEHLKKYNFSALTDAEKK